jgi:hypothetical protein
MIIINGKSMNPPTKKGDKYYSTNVPTNGPYTAKCFRASDSEGDFETLAECKDKWPEADRYIVVNEEYDGWSDINHAYMETTGTNVVIQGVGNSNITINFS